MTTGKTDFPRLPDIHRTDLHNERRFIFVPDDRNQDAAEGVWTIFLSSGTDFLILSYMIGFLLIKTAILICYRIREQTKDLIKQSECG